ncbi:MAG: DHH family phosphoesterase [Chloroflexota bacterium]|nr:DHH family phosphoesterase [Chloroflexota bacterium]
MICAHKKPDADTIGSLLGLSHSLRELGKQTTLVCADPLGGALAALPGAGDILTQLPELLVGVADGAAGDMQIDVPLITGDGVPTTIVADGAADGVAIDGRPLPWDLVVTVDVSSLDRLGTVYDSAVALCPRLSLLNIDHHFTNDRFGTVNLVDAQAAAATEVVALLLPRLGVRPSVPAATCLLAGLLTDSLSFQTDSTTSRTLRVAADLVAAGAPLSSLAFQLFRQRPLGSAVVWSRALGTLRFAAGGRIAWIEVTREMVADAGPGADSTGLSGFAGSIAGVDVGVVLEEGADGPIYVGLRSQSVDVAAVAAEFGGGGHQRAAGCQFAPPATLASAREALLPTIESALTSERRSAS